MTGDNVLVEVGAPRERCWITSSQEPTSSCRTPTVSRPGSSTHSRTMPTSCRACGSTRCMRCGNGATSTASSVITCGTCRYFLAPASRKAFLAGNCDLVPNHFSEVPDILRRHTKCSLVVAAASPPNRHGYFSLGTNCDYTASLIGRAPFFLEANAQMPRTFGGNQVHISQVVGWSEVDYPLDRGAHAVGHRRGRDHRCPGRGADPRRSHDPGRHRRHAERPAGHAQGSPRSRRPHRAAVRRGHRPRRGRCRHRHAEGLAAGQDRRPPWRWARNASTTSCTRTPPSTSRRWTG